MTNDITMDEYHLTHIRAEIRDIILKNNPHLEAMGDSTVNELAGFIFTEVERRIKQ